ncbi:unnamed protein product [Symbiodinium natans]|uniref:F-box domain-containing protein n=1 Tax=Symbiodinium natans TaxID=878477 RepID=A0A812THK9_9DINO|nr:unnamed protein product [Symbiodinium natans]
MDGLPEDARGAPGCAWCDLPPALLSSVLLHLDVTALCAAAAIAAPWSGAALPEVWESALLSPQVPPEEPGTYATVFTREGLQAARLPEGFDTRLPGWRQDSALQRLVSQYSPRALAHFVRRFHSGVEAEALRMDRSSAHLALEVLNFFPDPVWAAICLTDDPAEALEGNLNQAAIFLRGYRHNTSCLKEPGSSKAGTLVICSLFLGGSSVDLIRCPGFSRMEVGEHVLRGSYTGDPMVRFLLASSLSVGREGLGLETLLDLAGRSDSGAEVLIPTTRGSHYAMEPWQWEERGAPADGFGHELQLIEEGGLTAVWLDAGALNPSEALEVNFGSVLYRGTIGLFG